MTKNCSLVDVNLINTTDKNNIYNGDVITIVNEHETNTPPIEQVYLTTCLPKMVKGPHVHSGDKYDRFYCIEGEVVAICRNEETQEISEFVLKQFAGQYLLIPPNNSHALLNTQDTIAIVLSMPSEGYRTDKPYNQRETDYEGYNWNKLLGVNI